MLGDGKLGLLIAQVLQAHGARVTLYARHEEKLKIAGRAGVIHTSSANERPRARFQFVVDSTGSANGLQEAISMVRPRGTVTMKSTIYGEASIDTARRGHRQRNQGCLGSRCGWFEPAIELLRDRRVDVESMLAAEYPLDQAPAAFAEAARSGVLKIFLRNHHLARTSEGAPSIRRLYRARSSWRNGWSRPRKTR